MTNLKTEQDTIEFAKKMALEIKWPAVIALNGDLGAGKTTFVRGFIQALLGNIPVPSPTFTILQEYDTPRGKIVHADLYRINDPSELQELGLEELFENAIVFIEWPEKIDLPKNAISFNFTRSQKGLTIGIDSPQ